MKRHSFNHLNTQGNQITIIQKINLFAWTFQQLDFVRFSFHVNNLATIISNAVKLKAVPEIHKLITT